MDAMANIFWSSHGVAARGNYCILVNAIFLTFGLFFFDDGFLLLLVDLGAFNIQVIILVEGSLDLEVPLVIDC